MTTAISRDWTPEHHNMRVDVDGTCKHRDAPTDEYKFQYTILFSGSFLILTLALFSSQLYTTSSIMQFCLSPDAAHLIWLSQDTKRGESGVKNLISISQKSVLFGAPIQLLTFDSQKGVFPFFVHFYSVHHSHHELHHMLNKHMFVLQFKLLFCPCFVLFVSTGSLLL